MTPHDADRGNRAISTKANLKRYENVPKTLDVLRKELEDLYDAVRGLQSTDDPSLVPLHDEMMELMIAKEKEVKREARRMHSENNSKHKTKSKRKKSKK
jgi:hypothetical protein